MPLIYEDKQKAILEEEFGTDHSIEFDEWLGKLIDSISYKHESYENWLLSWIEHIDETGELQQVSFGTPVFDTLQGYKDIPLTSMPYGQSMAILALVEYMNNYI